MGVIRDLFGLGSAVRDVAEVFVPNKTKQAEQEHLGHRASVEQFGREFRDDPRGFHGVIDGVNRLPRPILALGTVGLFIFAMVDPTAFSTRMAGLDTIPHELWWLLGAIVSFYFGARELHYGRCRQKKMEPAPQAASSKDAPEENAAIMAWQQGRE